MSITIEEIEKKVSAIESMIAGAEKLLVASQETGNEEGVASATYLVVEYEQMLKEFCKYYNVQRIFFVYIILRGKYAERSI